MQLIEYNNLQIMILVVIVPQKLQMKHRLSLLVQPHRQKLIQVQNLLSCSKVLRGDIIQKSRKINL